MFSNWYDAQSLEEVVVVGFGTQKKASVVGAVQSIKPAELRVPSSNLSTSFAGRIAGVISMQRTGEPGAMEQTSGYAVPQPSVERLIL